MGPGGERKAKPAPELSLRFPIEGGSLSGDLALPEGTESIVLFAHGSGSSRKSPRNRFVAQHLHRAGHGTLLLDLLTTSEEKLDDVDAHLRFDIDLLAKRLIAVTDWIRGEATTRPLCLGLFGASTGCAAALVAAAERPDAVRAVVSRGGRPDLAETALARVRAPTLFIVGSADRQVLQLNRRAIDAMTAPKKLEIVQGATHLFEEAGALERVADLASDWFTRHLQPPDAKR